ncbi:MAG: IS605 family transposase OrfB [Candidatus Frackibacter sp. T328-2]|nr:MAG: IS605 family transposase OrfB [Candidatus Frackibacter sp. T328-2]
MINLSDKHHITIHHIKLYKPSKSKQRQLHKLLKNWNEAIRSALKIVKQWGFTAYTKSHKHTYRVSRNNFNLPSQVAIEANRKAIETYKSAENATFHRQVEVSLVNKKGFELVKKNDRYIAKIPIEGRKSIYCPLAFGKYQLNKIENPKYKLKTAKLYKYNNEWYLDLIMEYKQPKRETDTILGIDLGIVKLATFSVIDKQETVLHQECVSGKELRFKRMRYKQKRKAKARSSGSNATSLITENRLCKELNFKIANRIVELADEHNSLIVFEDLKNIRKNVTNDNTLNNYEKNSWAFYQLKQLIKHKADLKGIPYQDINAKDTSTTCCVCGKKGHRLSQNRFLCDNLHLQNADYNASINIAKKAI